LPVHRVEHLACPHTSVYRSTTGDTAASIDPTPGLAGFRGLDLVFNHLLALGGNPRRHTIQGVPVNLLDDGNQVSQFLRHCPPLPARPAPLRPNPPRTPAHG